MSEGDHAILARLDERTKAMAQSMDMMRGQINKIDEDLRAELKSHKTDAITRAEFDPIKRLVYGTVGLILFAVVSAIVASVLINGGK